MHPFSPPQKNRLFARAQRGAVILLVLVTVFLAAFLMSRFIQRAGLELLADARAADATRLRVEAYSALEVTLAVLADFRAIDTRLYSPAQGWAEPLQYAGYEPAGNKRVEINFEDESAKVSWPNADQATLQLLLEQAGLERRDAEQASDALLVWSRPDYSPLASGNDARNYERGELPHQPPWRALESWQELAAVRTVREYFYDEFGQPNARWHWLAANASLFAFNTVNINAASPAALSVAGLSLSQTSSLQNYFAAGLGAGVGRYFRSAAEAESITGAASLPGKLGAHVQILRIHVTVHDGAAVYRLSAVVVPLGEVAGLSAVSPRNPPTPAKPSPTLSAKKLDYPFRILEIQEEVNSDGSRLTLLL